MKRRNVNFCTQFVTKNQMCAFNKRLTSALNCTHFVYIDDFLDN